MNFIKSFYHGRFLLYETDNSFIFLDVLTKNKKKIAKNFFFKFNKEDLIYNYFKYGFIGARLSISFPKILFWQFPCITELKAADIHLNLYSSKDTDSSVINTYLPIPWATIIDKNLSLDKMFHELSANINGIKFFLKDIGINLRVHTVCQHIYWERLKNIWSDIGLTDAWISHSNNDILSGFPFKIHPWSLYAVNVEDQKRNLGIKLNVHPDKKKYLASFIGTHSEHYLSNVRLSLAKFSEYPNYYIKYTNGWHFENIVYKHQVMGLPLTHNYEVDNSVYEYNRILSDSKFVFCPPGAGLNTLRLWEALAVGSVPILIDKFPAMPEGGSLPKIDWNQVVLKFKISEIHKLPEILSKIPSTEIYSRQQKGLEFYSMVKNQTCF